MEKLLPLYIALGSVLGCGSSAPGGASDPPGDGATDTSDGPDLTPPQIVSVTPGDAVWIHDRFAIRFSEPVAPDTVAPAIELRDPAGQLITGPIELAADGRTAFVRAVDIASGIGTLRLSVAGSITDLAGNPLTAQTVELALAPWAKAGLDLGIGIDGPAFAVGGDDAIVATTVIVGGTQRITVSHGSGVSLGDPLGERASAPALAIGTSPVVAWVEDQTIEAARWDGAAWVGLPSPGTGSRPAVAGSAGAIGLAWVDGTGLHTARLVGDAWVDRATIAATIVADPAVAMADDSTLLAAFIDRAGGVDRIRVATVTDAVVEKPRLALFAPPPAGIENHVSIAARAGTVIVGWDEFSGYSLSAHVARSSGGSWTLLPTLDVDVPGDARGTSVAIDADSAPVASWIEDIDGANRGFVARFDGSTWVTVGGYAWNASPIKRPLRAELALWHDRVPMIASRAASSTKIDLARFNGPATPQLGLTTRASIAGCAIDPAAPPSTLSATGCFAIASGVTTPHPGLVPYDLRSELWSDGALKRRWIGLPDGAALGALADGSLDGPTGTLIAKEFGLDDPADRTIIETRFLIRIASGWTGLSYRWRPDGSDADLVAANASPIVTWGTHDHQYPDRATCLRCHNATVGQTLGLRRDQLARRFDYNGILDDQPRVLAQLGVLPAAAVPLPVPPPHDPRVSIEQRVRGYIAVNCSHCHNPAGECGPIDFRLATPLASTRLCDYLVPGDPESSRVFQLISIRPEGMPAAGSLEIDPMFVDLMSRWISSLTSCP